MIEFEEPQALIHRLENIIREVRPSLVLTHYPGHAVHPDHNALGEITVRAISRLSTEDRPKVYLHAFARECQDVIGPPDIVNDISAVADVKLAAIRAHKSQSQVFFGRLENGQYKEGTQENPLQNFLVRESFWTYRLNVL